MNIEPAYVRDAEEILELQKLAYRSEAAIYDDYAIPPLTQTLEEMRADFNGNLFLKASDEGTIIGSVRGHLNQGTCFIGRLIVHPAHQGRGLGTSLMNAIDRLFAAWSEKESLRALLDLRLSFADLSPRESDRVAQLVAGIHGDEDLGAIHLNDLSECELETNRRMSEAVLEILKEDGLGFWVE